MDQSGRREFSEERFILKNLKQILQRKDTGKEGLSLFALVLLTGCGGMGGKGSSPSKDAYSLEGGVYTGTNEGARLDQSASTADLIVMANGGDDHIRTGSGNDHVDAGIGHDVVCSGDGNDIILGGDGNDLILAGHGNDNTNCGTGDDVYVVIGNVDGIQYDDNSLANFAGQSIDLRDLLDLESINQHEISDIVAGETIDGGLGLDTIVVLGSADLSQAQISNISRIVFDTDVTLGLSELLPNNGAIETIQGDGDAVLRFVKSNMSEEWVTISFDDLVLSGVNHINIGYGVTLEISDFSKIQEAQIDMFSGGGIIRYTGEVDDFGLAGIVVDASLRIFDSEYDLVANAYGASVQNINDAPYGIEGGPFSLNENVSGSSFGYFYVLDVDSEAPLDPFGQHVLTVDDVRFEILADGTLKLKDGVSLDHEAEPTVTVMVTATDDGGNGLSLSKEFLIEVNDVNEAPMALLLDGASVEENDPGAVIGQLSVSDPDAAGSGFVSYTYALTQYQDDGVTPEGNPSNVYFEITPEGQLQLRSGVSLDHEDVSSVDILVQATNTENPAHTISNVFTVNVDDVNEAPAMPVLDNNYLSEDADTSGNVSVGNLSAVDPDAGDNVSFSITGGADADKFVIVGSDLQFKSGQTIDRDVQSSYDLEITAVDGSGLSSSAALQVDVSAIRLSQGSISENTDTSAGAVALGALSSPGLFGAATFSIVGGTDQSAFSVADDTLRINQGVVLDHESKYSLEVVVEATDGVETVQATFHVAIEDVNEAPAAMALSASVVDENAVAGIVGQLTVSDPDAAAEPFGSHVYAVDDARFEVTSEGVLKLAAGQSLDFEAEASVLLRVTATDNGGAGLSVSRDFNVTVGDVNEAPSAIALDDAEVSEGVSGAVVGQVSVTDPDLSALSFGQHVLSVDDVRFEILADGTLKLKDGISLDHEAEPTVVVTVTATDDGGKGLSLSKEFLIEVTDVNEAPTGLLLDGASVEENDPGAAIGQLSVSDPDAAGSGFVSYTYALTQYQGDGVTPEGNPLNVYFEITPEGQLQLKSGVSLDHEGVSSVDILVQATNTANPGHTISKTFTVTVEDVNEAPAAPVLDSNYLSETADTSSNVSVGNLSAPDPDAGDSVSFSITGGADADKFVIVGSNLQFKSGQTIDRDVQGSYDLEITAVDGGGLSGSASLQIDVSAIRLDQASISENIDTSSGPVALGALSSPGLSGAATFSIAGGADQASFSVSGDTLRINQGVVLDHEGQDSLEVVVEATDGVETVQATFHVAIQDVNEAPASIALSASEVDENAVAGIVGQLTVSDPDAVGEPFGSHVYAVDDARFEVTSEGVLKLAAGQSLDFEAEASVLLRVTATDNGGAGLSVSRDFTVTVGDVNEAPSAIALDDVEVSERVSGAVVGQVNVTDPDLSSSSFGQFSYEVSDSRFEVSETGVLKLKFGNVLDFESETSIPLTITATDDNGAGHDISTDVVVLVTDANEMPTSVGYDGRTYVTTGETADTALGHLSTVDPDSGDTHTYSILSVRDDLGVSLSTHPFDISGNVLGISASASAEELAALSGHDGIVVRVQSTDSGGLNYLHNVTFSVLEQITGQDDVADSASGTDSAEVLVGLSGNDQLEGLGGNDILDGGADDDLLSGGTGADTFVYRIDTSTPSFWSGRDGLDTIQDFSLFEGDKLQFIDNAGQLDDIQDFMNAFDAGLYSAYMTDEDSLTIKFANNDQGGGFVTGQHQIDIDFDAPVDAGLFDANTGQFNSGNSFVQALGGDAALIFG